MFTYGTCNMMYAQGPSLHTYILTRRGILPTVWKGGGAHHFQSSSSRKLGTVEGGRDSNVLEAVDGVRMDFLLDDGRWMDDYFLSLGKGHTRANFFFKSPLSNRSSGSSSERIVGLTCACPVVWFSRSVPFFSLG